MIVCLKCGCEYVPFEERKKQLCWTCLKGKKKSKSKVIIKRAKGGKK